MNNPLNLFGCPQENRDRKAEVVFDPLTDFVSVADSLFFNRVKNDVAALNIRLDAAAAQSFETHAQGFHPDYFMTAEIDSPQQGDIAVSFHALTVGTLTEVGYESPPRLKIVTMRQTGKAFRPRRRPRVSSNN